MKTEFLKKLGIDDAIITHIMAENGRDIQREKERTEAAIALSEEKQTQILALEEQLKSHDADSEKLEELTRENDSLREALSKKEQEELERETIRLQREQFEGLLGERRFLNSYTEQAIFEAFQSGMSEEFADAEAVFRSITDGVDNLFLSKNPPAEIPGIAQNVDVSYDQFQKMSYADRVRLYNDDPSLYRELKSLSQIID